MAKVAILKGTGSPHWTGLPSTSGQNSGTFGEICSNFNLGVPANKSLLTGTVAANNSIQIKIVVWILSSVAGN